MDLVVRIQDNSRPRSVFDQFFGRQRDVSYTAMSNTAKITVLPLSQNNKPASYSGAVGEFSIRATVDKNQVKANEAINLNIAVQGKGNIKLLENLPINFPPDFEVYDPKVVDKIGTSAAGVSGTRSFEYVIIPRHSGSFTIPSIPFSYFNPTTKKYVELETGEIVIDVEKGNEEQSSATFRSSTKEDLKYLGKDIRYIKTNETTLQQKGEYFFKSFTFWVSFFASPFLFLLFFFINKEQRKRNSNLVMVKSKKATKIATKRLKTAKSLLSEQNDKPFYEEIFKALFGYLSDKLNIPVADLNRENITDKLVSRQVNEEVVSTLSEILDRCEMARFAPVSEISKETIYEQAVKIISQLEGGIR